jgi:hypothetical protein
LGQLGEYPDIQKKGEGVIQVQARGVCRPSQVTGMKGLRYSHSAIASVGGAAHAFGKGPAAETRQVANEFGDDVA